VLVNLLPCKFTLLDKEGKEVISLSRSENPPRVVDIGRREGGVYNFGGVEVEVSRLSFQEVKGIPEESLERSYIVTREVAQALPDRCDLYFPDKALEDKEGNIIGFRALARL